MKLLHPTNNVYNFKNNAIETENGGIKTTYSGDKACCQVIMWSRKPFEARDLRHVGT